MIGAVIGNYQIVRKLGEGGMGAVYLGQHMLLGRRAAIKVLRPELSARTDIVNRFFNEARAVTAISDPGIVQVFDFGYHTDGTAFIVMEFLEGEALDRRLARLGKLAVHEALLLGRQIANSLAAAHAQHIVHRDLKPENIFLVHDVEVSSGERSKILDFGIAKLSDDHPNKIKTSTGMLMGTPAYMSPEQCRGLAEIDHRSDIYSLGCVMFHLLTGRLPFEGEGVGDIISAHIRESAPAPSTQVPGIPANVDAVVLRCLAKNPSDRFRTMIELSGAISSLLQQLPGDTAVNTAQAYHLAPTTKVPLGGTLVPPLALEASTGQAAPVMPTTLGGSASQFTPVASRRRRAGLWIAGGLVICAAGIGIAIVQTRGAETPHVAADPGGSFAPANQLAPTGSGSSSSDHGRGGDSAPAQDAGAVALGPSHKAIPDAGSPMPASMLDASSPEPSGIDAMASTAPATTKLAPAHGGVGSSVGGLVKQRPRDPGSRKELPVNGSSPSGPLKNAPESNTSQKKRPDSGPPSSSSQSVSPPATKNCSKAVFATVYNAAIPPPGSVRAALHNLKACHDAGAIGDAEFEQIGDALAARM